jgi:peptidoglycan/LPS O-acetylase OafA/YrhL
MASDRRDRPPELSPLTTVRFFAASYVVFYHFASAPFSGAGAAVRSFIGNGYTGVSFFFVLSGFILTYNYASRPLDRRRFFAARFARIYPLYLLAWLLSVPAALSYRFHKDSLGVGAIKFAYSAAAGLSLTQAWLPDLANSLNTPGWSLSVEAFFYATFAALLPRVAGQPPPRLVRAMAVAWAVSLLVPLAYVVANWSHPERLTPYETPRLLGIIKYLPVLHLPEFVIGSCCGSLFLERRRRGAPAVPSWVVAGLGAVTILVLAIPYGRLYPLVHNGLLAPLFGALVYAIAGERGGFARVLSRRPLVFLGEASYGVYILQIPVWASFLDATGRLLPGPPLVVFGAGFAVLVGASCLAFRLVEDPARAWIVRRLQPRARGALQVGAG